VGGVDEAYRARYQPWAPGRHQDFSLTLVRSIDEVLPIAKQTAEALEAAHEQGIIHRDPKPARADGKVKLLDSPWRTRSIGRVWSRATRPCPLRSLCMGRRLASFLARRRTCRQSGLVASSQACRPPSSSTNAKRLTAEIDLGADRRLTGLRLAFGVFIDS
jgi:hypothetical protein